MANIEKLIEKMKNKPNSIRPEEAEKILIYFNYIPVRQKGSHKHYLNKKNRWFNNNKARKSTKKSIYNWHTKSNKK